MTIRKKMALPVAAALMVLGMMVVAQSATATHPRPKGATPFYASTVVAYTACTGAGNRVHAPPLAFPSCNPPVQTSPNLTVGTPDANGVAAANSVGFIKLKVVGVPGGVDDTDVLLTSSISDVRCQAGVFTCGNANAADGPDYTGELQATATIRITDHNNAPTPAGPFTDTATETDLPFPVTATCANTADTGAGGLCTINTSADVVVPGSVPEGKRGNVEIGTLQVFDGGPDGTVGTPTGNALFEDQGIFIP